MYKITAEPEVNYDSIMNNIVALSVHSKGPFSERLKRAEDVVKLYQTREKLAIKRSEKRKLRDYLNFKARFSRRGVKIGSYKTYL